MVSHMLAAVSISRVATKKKLSLMPRRYGGPLENMNAIMTYWYVDMRNMAVPSMHLLPSLKWSLSAWFGTYLNFKEN